jgi:GMP synthase-like glutamine amidotransferase
MASREHILVIDPAVSKPEIDCFNHLVALSPLPLSYALPAMFGWQTLYSLPQSPKAIIILGSSSSVHDDLTWQAPLHEWVLTQLRGRTPIFGICYGHQMLAHLLGGEVGYLYPSREKFRGFREVEFTTEKGSLFCSHREIVTTCPPEMKVIAKSDLVKIEGLAHQKYPVWTLQSHPEATPSLVADLNDEPNALSKLSFGWKILKEFMEHARNGKTLSTLSS